MKNYDESMIRAYGLTPAEYEEQCVVLAEEEEREAEEQWANRYDPNEDNGSIISWDGVSMKELWESSGLSRYWPE